MLRPGRLTPGKAGWAADSVRTGESKREFLATTRVRPALSGSSQCLLRCLGPHRFQTGVGISLPFTYKIPPPDPVLSPPNLIDALIPYVFLSSVLKLCTAGIGLPSGLLISVPV